MKNTSGQALVESVVVVGIAIVLSVGLLAGATGALKASRFGRMKSLSVRYAQEAVEVVRNIRNTNWSSFSAYASGSSPGNANMFCLSDKNKVPLPAAISGSCGTNITNGNFSRSVSFTQKDPTTIQIDIDVSWTDGSTPYSTTISTYFTQWR